MDMNQADNNCKVLQVVWSLEVGGMERVVLHLARGLPAQGFDAEVVTLGKTGGLAGELAGGVRHWELSKGAGLDLGLAWSLAHLVKETGARLLHAHNTVSMLYAVLASLLTRKPVVATLHGANYGGPPRHRRLRRWLARRCAVVACVSRDALAAARDVDLIDPAKLRLVYNGIDQEQIAAAASQRDAARAELGLEPGQPVIISVGRLSPEKDYPTLLKAMALIQGQGLCPQLLLVGSGPERTALEEQARSLGLADAARFLGERGDVPRLLAASDLFALSSLSEGVSMALLEAMAAGLPVAATEAGGTPEVVVPGHTGLLVPPGDPEALANALVILLKDPARAREMGRAGATWVQAEFSFEAMARAYARLYERTLA
jgi:sugar transferase (PEP-CTERM/EpsH1 system associated)